MLNPPCVQASACWHDALTLAERSALARTGERARPTGALDAALARRRLQRWRSQPPFTTESLFAQRLAMDGLSEEDCLVLLGERADVVHADRPAALP